jgi:hypothetical protein
MVTTTAADHSPLPAVDTRRWTARRKAAIVAAVISGALTVEEACARARLSVEEFAAWQAAYAAHGTPGLRTTRLQAYRGQGRARRHHRRLTLAVALFATMLTPAIGHAQQAIGTVSVTPRIGLPIEEPMWTSGAYVFIPTDPGGQGASGQMLYDYTAGQASTETLGNTFQGTYSMTLWSAGAGPCTAYVAILDGSINGPVLWQSGPMTVAGGSADPLVEVPFLFSGQIPAFTPQSGVLAFAYAADASQPDNTCGWGGEAADGSLDRGILLTEYQGTTAPPPPPPNKTPEQVASYHRWADIFWYTGVASGVLSNVFPQGSGGRVGLRFFAIEMAILRATMNRMAVDPPGTPYDVVSPPTPEFPSPMLGNNACVNNTLGPALSNVDGIAWAASTAYDRMTAAQAAGDAYWTQQQQTQWTSLLPSLDQALANLPPAYKCLPNPPQVSQVTVDMIRQWQNRLAANANSPAVQNEFAALGVTDSTEINDAIATLTTANPNFVFDALMATLGPPAARPQYRQQLLQDADQ